MDSVIVFFGKATYEEVEKASWPLGFSGGTIVSGQRLVYLWRYTREEQLAELDEDELAQIQESLGTTPICAFQIASRHSFSARYALEVAAYLMRQFEPSILDDDYGNLWSPSDVQDCMESGSWTNLYTLRQWANKG